MKAVRGTKPVRIRSSPVPEAHKALARIAGSLALALAGNREIPKANFIRYAEVLERIAAWFREQSK